MAASRLQKFLPPQFVAVTMLAMVTLRLLLPGPKLLAMPTALIGVAPLAAGVYVILTNANRFNRIGTNIVTFDDPGQLVVDGWFARTRNPMYLGFVLMLIGLALLLGSTTVWVGPPLFFAAANLWYVPFEERRMRSTFGSDYAAYAAQVGRWF